MNDNDITVKIEGNNNFAVDYIVETIVTHALQQVGFQHVRLKSIITQQVEELAPNQTLPSIFSVLKKMMPEVYFTPITVGLTDKKPTHYEIMTEEEEAYVLEKMAQESRTIAKQALRSKSNNVVL